MPETSDKACRICTSTGPHPLYEAREMMFGLGDRFEYFQCVSCGCLQLIEAPADIGRYYPSSYYAHSLSPEARFKNFFRAALLRSKARFALTGRGLTGRALFSRAPEYDLHSLRRLGPKRDTSILDVGCGSGRMLYSLREIGFENLLGVDPFIECELTYANGLRIEKRFLAEVSGTWDIVMFHHAFEHVGDPLATLRDVRRILKPSGVCVIRIPKADSFAWRHYGVDWVQLDAPRHFFLHTHASIERMAELSGLRLTGVTDDSTEFQFMGSELYRRGRSHQDYSHRYEEFFGVSEISKFRARAEQLNKAGDGDSAAFYLQPAH